MADEKSSSKKASPLKTALLYSACSAIAVLILLLSTEVLMDATVLHSTVLIGSMGVCVLAPFASIFIRSEGLCCTVCRASLLSTLALAIASFYLRAKVSKLYVKNGYELTKEDMLGIASSTNPNGVVVLLVSQSDIVLTRDDIGIGEIEDEIEAIVAGTEEIKATGLYEKDAYTREDLEAVRRWSVFSPRIVYILRTNDSSQKFPEYKVLGANSSSSGA